MAYRRVYEIVYENETGGGGEVLIKDYVCWVAVREIEKREMFKKKRIWDDTWLREMEFCSVWF